MHKAGFVKNFRTQENGIKFGMRLLPEKKKQKIKKNKKRQDKTKKTKTNK